MFADGNRLLLERLSALEPLDDPRAAVKAHLEAFVAFAMEDPVRNALMFQRVLPGFVPSAESMELARRVVERVVALLKRAGVTAQGDVDCVSAVSARLTEAQLSNDPGGDRWVRHLDRLVDLLVDDVHSRRKPTRS